MNGGVRSLGRRKGLRAIREKKKYKKKKGLYDAPDDLFVHEIYMHEFLRPVILFFISFHSYLHSFLSLKKYTKCQRETEDLAKDDTHYY